MEFRRVLFRSPALGEVAGITDTPTEEAESYNGNPLPAKARRGVHRSIVAQDLYLRTYSQDLMTQVSAWVNRRDVFGSSMT